MFGLICRQKEWDKSNCKLLKFPFSLFTNSVRRHLDECNPFCSFIVYTDAALTLCLLTLRQELIVLISPFFFWPLPHFLFLLFWVIIVWNQKADLPVLFLEEHTHQTRCLLTTALQDDGKGGLFFFFNLYFFVSSDSITVANAALEYKLKSLVTDTLCHTAYIWLAGHTLVTRTG